ncbi:uncharacterized protein FOMMEDRAFT_156580, partial [Fomitiporia mediterranea MF3/22]|uniref:uncharacterized protein n=1 Tax=Fomitiporia mediterranea (strain MF3/22) TaxID=694068 RepID=UPI00044084EA
VGSLAVKYHGSHGDHAEDQKAKHRLLGEWKAEMTRRELGVRFLDEIPDEQREDAILEAQTCKKEEMGEERWNLLNEQETLKELVDFFADEAFLQLTEDERRRLKLWIWTGCDMHKDLNAVKGGDSAMREKWKEMKDSPVILANRDNAAVLSVFEGAPEAPDGLEDDEEGIREENPAEKRAREVSSAGAGLRNGKAWTGRDVNQPGLLRWVYALSSAEKDVPVPE